MVARSFIDARQITIGVKLAICDSQLATSRQMTDAEFSESQNRKPDPGDSTPEWIYGIT